MLKDIEAPRSLASVCSEADVLSHLMKDPEDVVCAVRQLWHLAAVVGHLDEVGGADPRDGDQRRHHQTTQQLTTDDRP